MKFLFLWTTFLLTLVPLSAQATCVSGDPSKLYYMRRDNNRCEGLLNGHNAGGNVELVSFSTSNLSSFPNTLVIRIPGVSNPTLVMQEFSRSYRLDDVQMASGTNATFSLNTQVLRGAGINPKNLLTSAYVIRNASTVYYPSVLGGASGTYTFVLYNASPTAFKKIEIHKLGTAKPFLSQSLSQPRKGQIPLMWRYGNAPPGDYELYIEDSQGRPHRFRFKHNPSWL